VSVTGSKTFTSGCAAFFFDASRMSLKCKWKASLIIASDGACFGLSPFPTLEMNPVMAGSTAASQIFASPRARLHIL
jgi:hypothetical protein